MTAPFSGGPLQQSDLLGIWASVMDDSYTQPFVAAGDGGGLEAWNQSFAQLARVSTAVDVTMSSLFILPWSGQTSPPATGPVQATVQLSISRSKLVNQPLVLGAGLVWVDEIAPDWSPTGTQQVNTGLRYYLASDVVFEPGESGPVTVQAIAERPGFGYNNPQPGSLSLFEQPGTAYYNIEAAITNTNIGLAVKANAVASTQMVAIDVPHVFVPGHVGQYVTITAGTDVGAIARMVSYRPTNGVDGGAVGLEMLVAIHASTFAGSFSPGELVTIGATGYAVFKHSVVVGGFLKASFIVRCGTVAPGVVITGLASAATATVDLVYADASKLANTTPPTVPSTESWRILDWVTDWGLTVTNAASPSGGTAGTLDLLGKERGMPRIAGESDAAYRTRISTIADVVTPNAVKRRLNRLLSQGPLQLSWCLREIGTALFPGFFYGDGRGNGDFYDYDAQLFTGVPLAGYLPNEPVTQTNGSGVVSSGKILMQTLPPATPFVPGQAATTGNSAGVVVVGVAGIRLGYPFVAGLPVVGTRSKHVGTPTTVVTGSGLNNSPNNPGSTAWRLSVDYLRMRGYFVVTIQRSGAGEYGFGWGNGALGVGALADWWDVGPGWNDFYDGGAIIAAKSYLSAFHSIDAMRAAGVFFEVLPSAGPCV